MNFFDKQPFFLKQKQLRQILPGLVLSVIVAGIARIAALFIPKLGGATLAILFGIFIGNTLFKQAVWQPGTKFSESKLLECSVVLLGLTVTFQTIAQMGFKGVIFIVLQMAVTITAAYLIGQQLGFTATASLMMAGGNGVCGSSAIASIAPVVQAPDEEKGQIITLVNLQGTVMMLTLPFLGLSLFGTDIFKNSALLGGILQSVGQVVAGASLLNAEIVQYSMLFKLLRILCLAFVVYFFKRFSQSRQPVVKQEAPTKKKLPLPWYVIGFLLFCIANSLFTLPAFLDQGAHFISTWFEITALAAIGLRLDLSKFIKEGPRFIQYAGSVGIIQTLVAVGLIYLLFN